MKDSVNEKKTKLKDDQKTKWTEKPKGDAERAIKREIKCLHDFAESARAEAERTEIVARCHGNRTERVQCGK